MNQGKRHLHFLELHFYRFLINIEVKWSRNTSLVFFDFAHNDHKLPRYIRSTEY